MRKRKLFTTVFLLALSVATVNGQALKITADGVLTNIHTCVNNLGTGDGFAVITKNSTKVLQSGSDLVWLGFYQTQPNNPGILSLTSLSSPSGWDPCFVVRANGKVGIMNPNPSVALEIGSSSLVQQVKVNGNIVWGSDVRMKNNIQDLSNSLSKLKKLRGVSYNLIENRKEQVIPEKILKDSSFNITKKQELQMKSLKENNSLLNRNFYGFLAQDVQGLFPDLVYKDDSTGMLSVDYIGIIPLLLDGLKEQQTQIENQQIQIDAQKEQIAYILKAINCKNLVEENYEDLEAVPLLFQNTPNPSSQSTEISFFIPKEVAIAKLFIFDMQGNQKRSFLIDARENGSIAVNVSSFEAGIYFYTLICDNKSVDTKQIILVR